MRTIALPTFVRKATLAFCVFLAACSSLGVARFDSVTYKSLTDLRPVALRVYAGFAESQIDEARVDSFKLQLEQLEEYETWKGYENKEMVDQVKALREMFDDHLLDRRQNGPWTRAHLENKKRLFLSALKIVVETESAKNRSPK